MDLDGLTTTLRNEGCNELEAIVGTIAETPLEQGEAPGSARGLGKGGADGKAETLLRRARVRLGDIPVAQVEEVRSAGAAALDLWR